MPNQLEMLELMSQKGYKHFCADDHQCDHLRHSIFSRFYCTKFHDDTFQDFAMVTTSVTIRGIAAETAAARFDE